MTDISAGSSRPRIPVWRTAYDGYRLGLGAIFSSGAMFRYFVYGSVSILAVFGALIYANFVMARAMANAGATVDGLLVIAGSISLGFLGYVLIAAVQAPLGVIVQRHIMLGDSPRHSYFGYLTNSYGRRFFGVSVVIYAFFYMVGLVHVPILYLAYGVDPFDERALTVLMTGNPSSLAVILSSWSIAFVIAALLSARSTFAFAIAAVDRPDPALRQSFVESRGAMWRLFFVFALIFIPPLAIYFIVTVVVATSFVLQNRGEVQTSAGALGNWAMIDVLQSPQIVIAIVAVLAAIMLSHVAMASAAARAYQIRVERGLSGVAEVFS